MNTVMQAWASVEAYELAAILLLTLCSFLTRALYFLFGDRLALSEHVRQALRYAPVAALTAIIVPELAPLEQGWQAFYATPWLAAWVAVVVYAITRSTLLLMIVGMLAYSLLRWVI